MALTKKQIKAIEEVINRRFLSFTYESLGPDTLTEEEINKLKSAGLIRSNVRNMIGDSHIIGKVVSLLPLEDRARLGFDEIMTMAKKMKPMTGVEKQAIEYATERAGVYIKGLKDDMIRRVTSETARAGETALRRIQDGIKQTIVNRETRTQLASNLFNIIDNKNRDWLRVAHTEINSAIQNGVYREIRDASDEGSDQLVYKRPNPDACVHCKRVYLKSDGVTPKIFKLSQLADTNVGLKANNWKPTIGSVHPWCFDEETEVLTDKGWMKFKDTPDDAKILSVNLETHDAEWANICERVSYHYKGRMHKYKSKICDILITPNHKTVFKTQKKREWRLEHDENLPKNYSMLATIPGWKGNDKMDIERVRFVAWFLAEGSITPHRNYWQISISQSKEENKIDIANTMEKVFGCRPWVGKNSITIRDFSSEWLEYLTQFGKSYDKYIPRDIKCLSTRLLREFLDVYLRGDGYERRVGSTWEGGNFAPERVYYTSSPRMMSDLCELILKIGKRPSVTDPNYENLTKTFKNGTYTVKHPCWTIRECTTTNISVGDNMFREVVDYDGMVYDFSLSKNHTLFVKRNGKVVLSGNCNCQLMVVPEGYDFVKRPVAKENFKFNDKPYRVGQVIREEDFVKFSTEQKNKTALDAILEYTGTTGEPIKKSEFVPSDVEDDMCNCDH